MQLKVISKGLPEMVSRTGLAAQMCFDAIRKSLAQRAIAEVTKGFREQRDPYGHPWKPSQMRQGATLSDKGLLRGSFTAVGSGNTITVGSNLIYAQVHQFGATIVPKRAKFLRFRAQHRARGKKTTYGPWIFAKKVVIPARPMVPGDAGLGPIWTKAFDDTARQVMRRMLGR